MPPSKRARTSSALSISAIRRANPKLDDEQGPRAQLLAASTNDSLDEEADYLCGHAQHAALVARKSSTAASPSELMLYTTDDSAEMLAAAIHAGFFCFASEFRMKGRRLEARGLLNLELAGPNLEPTGEIPGGRIVLDLTPAAISRLVVGKRSIKTIRPLGASSSDGERGFAYRLTVHTAFERTWAAIVEEHGVDWLGFQQVRDAYHALHRRDAGVRVLSIELWDTTSGELASAEVGALVGGCYTCLSLFARSADFPRCEHVRAQAAVLWLRRAGIRLYDVGTTAGYYVTLFGFERKTRAEFVQLWRAHRGAELSRPELLRDGCDDVRELLEAARDELAAATGAPPPKRASGSAAAAAAPKAARPAKFSVRVSPLPAGDDDALAAAIGAAFGACGAVERSRVVSHGAERFGVVVFADASGVDAAIRLDGTAVQIGDAAQIVTVSAGPGRAKERKRAGRGDAEEPAAKRQRRQEPQGAGCSVELQPTSGESVVVRCSFADS